MATPPPALYSCPMVRGVVAACVAAIVFAAPAAGAAAQPLRTGVVDPLSLTGSDAQLNFDRVQRTGSTVVKLLLYWRGIAPGGEVRPDGFDATDPTASEYNAAAWERFDEQVLRAVARGLDPIVYVYAAPDWAEGTGQGRNVGIVRPDPVELGHFARAAATRYSGSFVASSEPDAAPLPRVKYWQVWNEPNRDYYLMPQFVDTRLESPRLYRAMVNRFADGVRTVPGNLVVAGGLAPIGRPGKPAPLRFMRALLAADVKFDVWAHHPYTSGGPTHKAAGRNNVSLGDLPEMRKVLRAAVKRGRVHSTTRSVAFWVTEFSWDAKPADPRGLPANLHARWVSEALYRMWTHGVSLVVWFKIKDEPLRGPGSTPYQSGFWTVSDKRKRSFTAFRFPTVAFIRSKGVFVWGRSPTSRPGTVVVEIKAGRRWRRLGTLTANGSGIFKRTYRTPVRKGYVRARFGGETSLPFSLTPVRDRYVNPFGCGGAIPC